MPEFRQNTARYDQERLSTENQRDPFIRLDRLVTDESTVNVYCISRYMRISIARGKQWNTSLTRTNAEAISDVLSISRDKLATTTMITVALGYQFITVRKQTIA